MSRVARPPIPLGTLATRRPVCIDREESIADASRLMRAQDVDELVVTEPHDGYRVPAGVLSARDVVTRVVAFELDPAVVTVGDILWSRTAPAHVEDTVPETLQRLCATGAVALPVIDRDGLAGVVSVDDLLRALAEN
jgi:predicted transcriptional regulator